MEKERVELALVDALDHLLDRGVMISGEAVISIGSVDLLYLSLNVVLANIDTMIRATQAVKDQTRIGGGTKG
jgi:hypothetical protein